MSSVPSVSTDARPGLQGTVASPTAKPVAELHAAARGSLANLVGLAVSGVFQIVLVGVIAHALGARGAGIFFSAIALFTIVANIGELGADTGLVRYVSRYRSIGRSADVPGVTLVAIAPVIVIAIGFGMLLYLFAPQLAGAFSQGRATTEIVSDVRVLAPFVPIASASTVILSATRGFGTMAPYVYIQNVALPIVRPVAIVVVMVAGLSGIAVIAAWAFPLLAVLAVGVLAITLLLRRNASVAAEATPKREMAGDFWRFTGPRAFAAMFGITITWLDILLVSGLRSAQEAGVYASVSRLSIVGAYALNALGMAIAPQLSFLLARRRERDAETVLQVATAWLMALTWPLYVGFAVFGDVMLRAIGKDLSAGHTALAILAIAQLVNVGTGNVVIVLLMAGRSTWALIDSAIALALNVGLNLVLIPHFGISGAAIAWMVSIVFNNVAALIQVRVVLRISPLGRGHALVAVASALCFGALGLGFRWLLGATPASLLAFGIASGAFYSVVMWKLRHRLELPTLARSIARKRQPVM